MLTCICMYMHLLIFCVSMCIFNIILYHIYTPIALRILISLAACKQIFAHIILGLCVYKNVS